MALFESPLGQRGEHPVQFPATCSRERLRGLLEIPGIIAGGGLVRCTWDAAPTAAALLETSAPVIPAPTYEDVLNFPGYGEYVRLGFPHKLRPYQKPGALYLAWRSAALNCDAMRLGKSLQALAASVLVGAQKVLIICPAISKLGWAREVGLWLEDEAIYLSGRGANAGRQYCLHCMGRGRVGDKRCKACRLRNGDARGYRIFDVEQLVGKTESDKTTLDPLPGKTRKRTKQVQRCSLPGTLTCSRHPEVAVCIDDLAVDLRTRADCPTCAHELHAAIDKAKYIIVNYDLLVPQRAKDGSGRSYFRDDLKGWSQYLAQFKFDVCIADEIHMLRGWTAQSSRQGQSRREVTNRVTDGIPIMWGLTGTPIFGYVRDLWGPIDTLTRGAASGRADRLPFAWHVRYCGGQRGTYGWEANGRTIYADTELKERLDHIKIQRARSEVIQDMPPKIRQVIYIDDEKNTARAAIPEGGGVSALMRLFTQTAAIKRPIVAENVVAEMAEGNKVVVFAYHRKSAELLAKEIADVCAKRDHRTRMRQVNAEVLLAHGDIAPAARYKKAEYFREHEGACAFVTTIDSVQVSVDLRGAVSVHFADLHWQPSAMLQAEDRPNAVGITHGLSIVYYIVRGSIDEHVESVVLPKVESLSRIVEEEGADSMQAAFQGNTQESTVNEIMARLTAHLVDED